MLAKGRAFALPGLGRVAHSRSGVGDWRYLLCRVLGGGRKPITRQAPIVCRFLTRLIADRQLDTLRALGTDALRRTSRQRNQPFSVDLTAGYSAEPLVIRLVFWPARIFRTRRSEG